MEEMMTDTPNAPDFVHLQHATFMTEDEFAAAAAGRVWLASYAGCASERLSRALALSYPAMDGRERPLRGIVSHVPRPMAGPEKCIYLYGPPRAALMSQARGGHYDDRRKLDPDRTSRNAHHVPDVVSTCDASPLDISGQFLSFCTDFVEYPIILIRNSAIGAHFSFLVHYLRLNASASWQDAPRDSKLDVGDHGHRQLASICGATQDIMEQMPSIVIRLPVWKTGFKYEFGKEDLIGFEDLLHLRQDASRFIEGYTGKVPPDWRVRIKHAIEYLDSAGQSISLLNVRHDIVDQGYGSIGSIVSVNRTTGSLTKITHQDIEEGSVFSGGEDPRYFRRRGYWCVLFNGMCHDRKRRIFLYLDELKCCIKLQVSGIALRDIEKNWTPFVVGDVIYILYSLNPVVVLQLDDDKSGRCHVVGASFDLSSIIEPMYPYGGSALQLWTWPYFIGLTHTRHPYRCAFYVFDAVEMKVVAVGKPFHLPEPEQAVQTRGVDVQYPYHLEIDDGRCFVWVEIQDHCPTKYEFKFESLCEVISSLIATRICFVTAQHT